MGLGTAALGLTLGGIGAAASSAASLRAGEKAQDAADTFADRIQTLARETGIPTEDLFFAFANPNLGNVPLAGASASALQQLGLPVRGTLEQSSPAAAALNGLGTIGATSRQFNQTAQVVNFIQAKTLENVRKGMNSRRAYRNARELAKQRWPDGMAKYGRALQAGGFSGESEFLDAVVEHGQAVDRIASESAEVAPDVRQGRLAALRNIAQLQREFPTDFLDVTPEGIAATEDRVRAERLRELQRGRAEQEERILEMANLNRVNPGGILGELEEEFSDQRFRLENTGALERALTLLQGQSNLQAQGVGARASAIGALSGSLNDPIRAALATGQVQSQGTQSAGSLAARQALVLNDLRVQQEQFEAQLRAAAHEARAGGDIADIQGKLQAAQNAAQFTSSAGNTLTSFGMDSFSQGMRGFGGSSNAPATGQSPTVGAPSNTFVSDFSRIA